MNYRSEMTNMFTIEEIFQVMRVLSLGAVKSPKTMGVKTQAFHETS